MTETNKDFSVLEKRYHAKRKTATVFGWIFLALAVAGLIGLIVSLILLGLGKGSETVMFALCGASFAVVVVSGTLAFFFIRLGDKIAEKELDCKERSIGENAFGVGEETFAVFCEGKLLIRGKTNEKRLKTISVPYTDMRFFSVCVRHTPKEKGEWSVVLEIPVKYLAKDGKGSKDDSPALIQTAAKPRLYECLKQYGLTLLGELPNEGRTEKFLRKKRFILPDRNKRRRSLLYAGAGVVLIVGGVIAAVSSLLNATIGAIIAVLGFYLAIHGFFGFLKAKSVFAVYREGVYWKDKTFTESVFLKWEEILSYSKEEKEGRLYLETQCLYGSYSFPLAAGALEYLEENYADKEEK